MNHYNWKLYKLFSSWTRNKENILNLNLMMTVIPEMLNLFSQELTVITPQCTLHSSIINIRYKATSSLITYIIPYTDLQTCGCSGDKCNLSNIRFTHRAQYSWSHCLWAKNIQYSPCSCFSPSNFILFAAWRAFFFRRHILDANLFFCRLAEQRVTSSPSDSPHNPWNFASKHHIW